MLFTEEEIQMAKQTDLVKYLSRNGEEFIKSGKEWRWKKHSSVTIDGNMWYKHNEKVGGDAVEFLRVFNNMGFHKAVKTLLEDSNIRCYDADRKKKKERPKNFVLPEANKNMRRVYAYLTKTRGIDAEIVTHFVKAKMVYEEKAHHNVVFVGLDENGNPKSAFERGTLTEGERYRGTIKDSDLRYNFCHKGTSEKLYVFESPIDLLSFICLHKENWQEHSYIALGGLGDKSMLFFLQQNSHIKRVYLCVDSDEAGIIARKRMTITLQKLKYKISYMFAKLKDWNEDLVAKKKVEREEVQTGGMSL